MKKIKWQAQLINKLSDYINWLEDDTGRPSKGTDITKLDYKKMTLDDPPNVVEIERLNYKELLKEAEDVSKPIKKVRRHKSSSAVPQSVRCPKCGAPHDYLYKNNGNKGQYLCKVCDARFHEKNRLSKDIQLFCPNCEKHLDKIKERTEFDIYKCRNNLCPYYQQELTNLTDKQKELFETSPYYFKLRSL